MSLNSATSCVLRWGTVIGIAFMIIGLILSCLHQPVLSDRALWLGIFVLICTPAAGIAVSYASLIKEKDWRWVKAATVLIVVIVLGLSLSIL
jgi:uncharacterized membrane protein